MGHGSCVLSSRTAGGEGPASRACVDVQPSPRLCGTSSALRSSPPGHGRGRPSGGLPSPAAPSPFFDSSFLQAGFGQFLVPGGGPRGLSLLLRDPLVAVETSRPTVLVLGGAPPPRAMEGCACVSGSVSHQEWAPGLPLCPSRDLVPSARHVVPVLPHVLFSVTTSYLNGPPSGASGDRGVVTSPILFLDPKIHG